MLSSPVICFYMYIGGYLLCELAHVPKDSLEYTEHIRDVVEQIPLHLPIASS